MTPSSTKKLSKEEVLRMYLYDCHFFGLIGDY